MPSLWTGMTQPETWVQLRYPLLCRKSLMLSFCRKDLFSFMGTGPLPASVSVYRVCMVSVEAWRGHQILCLELELQIVMRHHVGASN